MDNNIDGLDLVGIWTLIGGWIAFNFFYKK
jgi:hypothetical protein